MNTCKMFYALTTVCLFAFSGLAYAVTYDFGNLQSTSSGYGVTNALNSSASKSLSATDSGLRDDDSGTQFGRGRHDQHAKKGKVKWEGGHSGRYTPVTSPVPEPEIYAMILAGLGLIGLTVRRRDNSNS